MNVAEAWLDCTAARDALAAQDLCLTRHGTEVLHGIDLRARPGRVLVLVGPNGAGKSSLLAVLAGTLAPTHGRATLDGEPLARWQPRALARRRALLSQNVSLGFGFSVREVVLLGRSPHACACPRRRDEHVVESALRATRVWHLRDRNYLQLSGGEQRRVQLARVLAQLWEADDKPAWLMLDEPEAGLDIAHQHFVLRLARGMARRGHGVVAVLHDLNLAARYADDVALLAQGRLLRYGTPDHALEPATLSSVYGMKMRRVQTAGTGDGWLVVPC